MSTDKSIEKLTTKVTQIQAGLDSLSDTSESDLKTLTLHADQIQGIIRLMHVIKDSVLRILGLLERTVNLAVDAHTQAMKSKAKIEELEDMLHDQQSTIRAILAGVLADQEADPLAGPFPDYDYPDHGIEGLERGDG